MLHPDHTGEPMRDNGGREYGTVGEFIHSERGMDYYRAIIPDELISPHHRHLIPYVCFHEDGKSGGGFL